MDQNNHKMAKVIYIAIGIIVVFIIIAMVAVKNKSVQRGSSSGLTNEEARAILDKTDPNATPVRMTPAEEAAALGGTSGETATALTLDEQRAILNATE